MNYFQELLESYEKIKKRKFSVRLDEKGEFQELEKHDPERAQAIEQKLMQEFDGYQGGTVGAGETFGIGNIPVTQVPDGQTAGTMDLPSLNQAYAVTLTPTSLEAEAGTAVYFRGEGQGTNNQIMSAAGNLNPRMFSAYKNALANMDGTIPTLDGNVDTASMNAGNMLGAMVTDSIKVSLKNLIVDIRIAAGKSTAEGQTWAEKPASYITGTQSQSLEKKFSQLRFVKLNPASQRLEEVSMDDAVKTNMMETALKSIENLYKMGLGFDSEAAKLTACENLSKSIRKDRGGKVVALTSEDNSEGIRWTPSPADKWFMAQAENICRVEIESTPRGKVDQNNINDMVGKSSEMATVVLSVLDVLEKNPNEEVSKDLATLTRKEVIKDIELFRASFGRWTQQASKGATDEEGAALAYVAEEVDNLIGGTQEEIMSFFKRLGRLQAPLTKAMGADITVNIGKEKGQGVAADTGYIYMGDAAEERATEVGNRFKIKVTDKNKRNLKDLLEGAPSKKIWMKVHGLSEEDLDQEVYMVGDGLKTKAKKFNEMTLGETDTMLDVVDGNAKEIVEGYYDTVKSNLGFSNADVNEVREYNSELRKINNDLDTILPQGGLEVYDPETGNTVLDNGKIQIETLRGLLNKSATYKDISSGPILRLFQDQKGQDLDLSDPVNMAKVNEGLKRYLTALRATEDSRQMKRGTFTPRAMQARKWLVYAANMAGGVDTEEVTTVQDVENMETMTGAHMSTIKEASKGILRGDWNVTMPSARGEHGHPGASMLLVNSNDEEDRLALRQTRTWKGKVAATRWSVVQPRHSFEKRASLKENVREPKASGESMLFSYLDNQQKILESLVQLIKTN